MDLPPLFTDNLIELLCRFNNEDLLTASRVNKQFYAVSTKLLLAREITVTPKKFNKTTAKQLPFVMQIRKLKFPTNFLMQDYKNDKYTQLIAQLTNLQSINIGDDGLFVFPGIKHLTQLQSMSLCFDYQANYDKPKLMETLSFENFKELKSLRLLSQSSMHLNDKLLPLSSQLTSLTLSMVNANGLQMFTNLEQFVLVGNWQNTTEIQNLLQNDVFALPRLTSLTTTDTSVDFTKWTQLKSIAFEVDYSRTSGARSLPPNMEVLTLPRLATTSALPTTLKHVTVTTERYTLANEKEVLYNSLRSLPERCVIELLSTEFEGIPEDIKKRENLTLVISTWSYGNTAWDDMSKFFNGTLPSRLHIRFSQWKNCRYKPKLLDLLKLAESKTRLLVDFS